MTHCSPYVSETASPKASMEPFAKMEDSENLVNFSTVKAPYHPPVEIIEPQVIADGTTKKTKYCLRFQKSWYKQYPWIHYDETITGVLCFTCIQAESLRLSDLSRKTEPTFIKNGFRNWKKAQERFHFCNITEVHRTGLQRNSYMWQHQSIQP